MEIVREIEALPGCTTYISAVKDGYVKEGADELYRWLTEGYQLDIKKLKRMPEDLPANDGILSVEMYHPTRAEEIAHQGFTRNGTVTKNCSWYAPESNG